MECKVTQDYQAYPVSLVSLEQGDQVDPVALT